jgi:predicted ATPase
MFSAEVNASHAIAEEVFAIGRDHADPDVRSFAAITHGTSCFYLGRLQTGMESYPTAHLVSTTLDFGFDGRSGCHAAFSRLLGCRGFPEQSQQQARSGLMYAARLRHLPTIAVTLMMSCDTAWILRDRDSLRERVSELIRLSREQGFQYWLARAECYAGWLSATDGKIEEGLSLFTQGAAALSEIGITLYAPQIRGMLADAQAHSGRHTVALALLDEALDLSTRTGEAWSKAELHRQKGELLSNDPAAAELSFQQAIEIARNQSAKLFELRATVSLAQLWRNQGKPDSARELLVPIYAWFTEGFGYPDLVEARTLLSELAPPPIA